MKIIKTKRFILRPMVLKDAKDIARNINNWNVIKNLSQLPFPYELKHAKQFIGRKEKEMKKEKPENYLMVIEIDGEVVGSIGAHQIVHGHKAELGYWLAEKHWGQGIMPEAVKKFMTHIFSEFKLHRIYAYACANNKGSMRVMEKVGMKFEGILTKYALKDGKYIDCHMYAKVK
ncbi:MAG: GNAT family protein [Candidatus Moranbacteria bacterium]|nr:GNAT family protein [Candidatus Moranbacteria bacterium]